MTQALIFFHGLMAAASLTSLVFLYRSRATRPVERSILISVVFISLIFLLSSLYPVDGFGRIQLLAWGVFLYLPTYLLASVLILYKKNRTYVSVLAVFILIILGVAVDAFLIEPNQLEITRITIQSSKIERPYKVVFLADLQTDSPGPAEERALALASEEKADLILFSGDYIQLQSLGEYQNAISELNRILVEAQLTPRLGAYAVKGNIDWNNWKDIFEDSGIQVLESTTILEIESLVITALSREDSGNVNLSISGSDSFHLVLGHSPNYSLGEIEADLLLAGHTHGGQFQLPGIGPLITISAVPNKWASGLTEIQPGRFLLVSRGIGLEHGNAPRMRFLCRPEIIMINLEPVQ